MQSLGGVCCTCWCVCVCLWLRDDEPSLCCSLLQLKQTQHSVRVRHTQTKTHTYCTGDLCLTQSEVREKNATNGRFFKSLLRPAFLQKFIFKGICLFHSLRILFYEFNKLATLQYIIQNEFFFTFCYWQHILTMLNCYDLFATVLMSWKVYLVQTQSISQ